jgi:periplasmic protein CpxP/Spy
MEEKKMSGKRSIIASVVVTLCLVAVTAMAGVAVAHDGGWRDGKCGGHSHLGFMEKGKNLGLTDAQKGQAKEIFQSNRVVVKPIMENLCTERKILRALIYADKIDETAIRAETAKIAGLQADLNVNRAKVAAQFRAILTPDQLTKLKTSFHKHQKPDNTTQTPDPAQHN